jgi:DNA polymerase-3 subunit epsilon
MREIVFDTETTGFGSDEHRVIELGCLELINRLPTGKTFHTYLNPEREIDAGATRVHGITADKVANAPRFADIVDDWLAFIGEDPLVAHNAEFDMAFMQMEMRRLNRMPLANPVVDTLLIARQKLPGQRHSLDALCRFYGVDLTARTYHGALLDAQLLTDVYVELMGGLQASFGLQAEVLAPSPNSAVGEALVSPVDTGVVIAPTEDELAAHQAFLARSIAGALWNK